MIKDDLFARLMASQDTEYRDFQAGLIPTIEPSSMIGVRTPELRKIAKEFSRREDISDFLYDIPHRLFEEDQIHSFIISDLKDYDLCIKEVEKFLPFINNWATCDQMSPKIMRRNKTELLEHIHRWLCDNHTYTVRFSIKMLMEHYLDDSFAPEYPELVASVSSEEYYVKMMQAWYFATALAKQYEKILPFLAGRRLDRWTHNKTIQKALESYRISDTKKDELRALRWR